MAVSIQKAIAARLVEHFAHSYKEYAIRCAMQRAPENKS